MPQTIRPGCSQVDGFGTVAYAGPLAQARAIRQALARRDGEIKPLVTELLAPERYVLERVLCVDTTAAGGNASLLAASEGSPAIEAGGSMPEGSRALPQQQAPAQTIRTARGCSVAAAMLRIWSDCAEGLDAQGRIGLRTPGWIRAGIAAAMPSRLTPIRCQGRRGLHRAAPRRCRCPRPSTPPPCASRRPGSRPRGPRRTGGECRDLAGHCSTNRSKAAGRRSAGVSSRSMPTLNGAIAR